MSAAVDSRSIRANGVPSSDANGRWCDSWEIFLTPTCLRTALRDFTRSYAFISQIAYFTDAGLEKPAGRHGAWNRIACPCGCVQKALSIRPRA